MLLQSTWWQSIHLSNQKLIQKFASPTVEQFHKDKQQGLKLLTEKKHVLISWLSVPAFKPKYYYLGLKRISIVRCSWMIENVKIEIF